MESNEIKGATNETIGKAQDVVGSVTGDAGAQLAGNDLGPAPDGSRAEVDSS